MAQFEELKRIPIVARSGLFVGIIDSGDGHRFAELFRRAWLRIPLGARRRMLAYWRGFGWQVPSIAMLDYWSGIKKSRAVATCFAPGHSLHFLAPVVDVMPAELAEDLVAHELRHVYRFAVGYEQLFGTSRPTEFDLEFDAMIVLRKEWGFDHGPLTKYLRKLPAKTWSFSAEETAS